MTDAAVDFRSHIDGQLLDAVARSEPIEIQEALGSDVAMVLDHVVALPGDAAAIQDACERTVRWAARCRAAATRADQALFAIVQGGLDRGSAALVCRATGGPGFPRLRHRGPERR